MVNQNKSDNISLDGVNDFNLLFDDLQSNSEKMIDNDYYDKKPNYITFFDNLQDYLKINRFFIYLIIALFPYFLYFPVSYIFDFHNELFTEYWVRLNFSGWALGSFLFMNYIYNKTISIFPMLSYLAHTPYNKHLLSISYDRLFRSYFQNLVCIITGLLTTATGTYLGMNLPFASKIYIIINSFFVGFIIGFGLWFSIGLAFLIRDISKMKNVKLNYLNPSNSIGIYEIPRLASVWSMCFFGEAIIIYIGLILPNWNLQNNITEAIQLFWLLIFLSITIYNFVHPISSISNLTNEAKIRFKQIVLDRLHDRLLKVENDLENLSNYSKEIYLIEELFEKVSLSKSYMFEWAVVLRFFATAIPTIFIIFLEHYSLVKKLFNLF